MGKDTKFTIGVGADTTSFEKSVKNVVKGLDRTSKSTKKANSDVKNLGQSFSQAANNVAIFNGQLDPISGRLSAIGTGISRFGAGSIAAAAGVGAMALAMGKAVASGQDYEQRMLRFNSLLRATSSQSGKTTADLEALAQKVGKDTLSNTAEAAEGINALLTFRKIQGNVFNETITLARDAQVAFGGNLREGVVAFGKALNDPIANLGALSRKGIQFDDAQKELIKSLWEGGDAAGAQNIILAEMRRQFGGLATDEAKTLKGSVDGLGHSWDNFWEVMGQTEHIKRFSNFMKEATDLAAKGLDDVAEKHTVIYKTQEKAKEYTEQQARAQSNLAAETRKLVIANDDLVAVRNELIWSKPEGKEKARLLNQIKYREFELKNQKQAVENAKKTNDSITALNNKFNAEQEAIKKKEQETIAKGESARLLANLEENKSKLAEVIKANDRAIIAHESHFESKRQKELRFYNTAISDLGEKEKQELSLTEKTLGNLQDVRDKYIQLRINAKKGLDAKLAAIDEVNEKRRIAEENSARRAIVVAENLAKKQAKFLAEIIGGDSELAKKEIAYNEDLKNLEEGEKSKTEYTMLQGEARAAFFETYRIKLKENYTKDVDDYIAAQNSKEQADRERAAKNAGRDFKSDLSTDFSKIEGGDGGLQSFFGVNLDESAEKFAAIESQYAEHLERIKALGLQKSDEDARIAEIGTERTKAQDELKKRNRTQAESDTWGAINVLASTGSKKAFAIAKAANIAKATMNTFQAASNALANVPVPFNYAAAGLVTAAGLAQVSQIKNQQMPQFHDGITTVPREGSYLLSQGERVLSPQLNADLKADLKRRSEGDGNLGGETSINLSIPDTGSYNATERWYEDNSDRIINHIRYAMNRP